jgi:hypothetical protein
MITNNEINKLTNQTIITDIQTIKDILNKLNGDIVTNITTKIYEMKQMYIDDLKLISINNNNDSYIKITDKIEKTNNIIIEKVCNVINDIIPKSQNNYYTQYENMISNFKLEISKDVENIRSNILQNKNDITVEQISTMLEMKYNNLLLNIQQSILSYISTSETRMTANIDKIIDSTTVNNSTQNKIYTDLDIFLNKHKVSSSKGLLGENLLQNVLTKRFPSAEVINTSGMYRCADFIIKRETKKDILIENKDYNQNVNKDELNKFYRDIEEQKINGLFISNNSGIATKKNFQIDINDGNIIVYIHNAEYCPDKISTAIDIIDNLTDRLAEINHSNNSCNISNELLSIINEQYQNFINKRESTINHIRESTKKTILYITDMELSQLNIILSSKFASTKQNNLQCPICKLFTGNNIKSLSVHKRTCKKKYIKPDSDNENSSEEIKLEDDNIKSDYDNTESNEIVPIKNKKNKKSLVV